MDIVTFTPSYLNCLNPEFAKSLSIKTICRQKYECAFILYLPQSFGHEVVQPLATQHFLF